MRSLLLGRCLNAQQVTAAAAVNARGKRLQREEEVGRVPLPRRDGRRAMGYNEEELVDEAMVYAVDARGTSGNLANRRARRGRERADGSDWEKARDEYGVFENQRNPGRQPMYSTRMKRKSAMREVELRVEGVTRRAREHEARERS